VSIPVIEIRLCATSNSAKRNFDKICSWSLNSETPSDLGRTFVWHYGCLWSNVEWLTCSSVEEVAIDELILISLTVRPIIGHTSRLTTPILDD
jgi:hypothetical protein